MSDPDNDRVERFSGAETNDAIWLAYSVVYLGVQLGAARLAWLLFPNFEGFGRPTAILTWGFCLGGLIVGLAIRIRHRRNFTMGEYLRIAIIVWLVNVAVSEYVIRTGYEGLAISAAFWIRHDVDLTYVRAVSYTGDAVFIALTIWFCGLIARFEKVMEIDPPEKS